jgi:hypothetical protein
MNTAKYKYKLTIRDAVRSFEDKFSDELLDSLISKDMKAFWKSWRCKCNGRAVSIPNIDGKCNHTDIADLFALKFSNLGGGKPVDNPPKLRDTINNNDANIGQWYLSFEDVNKIVFQKMKRGKAAGLDNISLEHIIYSHPSLIMHLSRLFNLMIKHGYVPDQFGLGVLIPLIKDKNGDTSDSDNYRGITVSPVISKNFETGLFDKFQCFFSQS